MCIYASWFFQSHFFFTTEQRGALHYCSIALARKPDQGQALPFHKPQDDIIQMHNSHMINKNPQIHPSTVFAMRPSIRSSRNSCQICLFNHYLQIFWLKLSRMLQPGISYHISQ